MFVVVFIHLNNWEFLKTIHNQLSSFVNSYRFMLIASHILAIVQLLLSKQGLKSSAKAATTQLRKKHAKSSIRAKVKHVFGVVKGIFRYRKTRYRGLRKQTAKLHIMFALANLYLADRPCLAV